MPPEDLSTSANFLGENKKQKMLLPGIILLTILIIGTFFYLMNPSHNEIEEIDQPNTGNNDIVYDQSNLGSSEIFQSTNTSDTSDTPDAKLIYISSLDLLNYYGIAEGKFPKNFQDFQSFFTDEVLASDQFLREKNAQEWIGNEKSWSFLVYTTGKQSFTFCILAEANPPYNDKECVTRTLALVRDEHRWKSFLAIQNANEYYRIGNQLTSYARSLDDLRLYDPSGNLSVTHDPLTHRTYEYSSEGSSKYTLCAVFETRGRVCDTSEHSETSEFAMDLYGTVTGEINPNYP
jgi:hypothetical protein